MLNRVQNLSLNWWEHHQYGRHMSTDEEVEAATKRLMALMEPITILIMTVFVVLIVFSIFLPMLSMTKAYDQYLQ